MARSQFTFTFANAYPGAAVSFSAAVFSSPVDAVADGPTLVLDAARTVAVWTDARELTATWVDGAGVAVTAEASVDRPVVSTPLGKPGQTPNGATPGSSWVEHDLSLLAADGIGGSHFTDTATWADAAGPIIQQTLDVGTGNIDWPAGLASTEYVIEFDVRIPSGQDAGTTVRAAFQVAEQLSDDDPPIAPNVGLGLGVIAASAGDTSDYALGPFIDGADLVVPHGAPVTIPADEWHTIRGVVSVSVQTFFFDGAYKGINMEQSGGNSYSANFQRGPDAVGLIATGLVDFRNFKVWTRALPA